VLSKIARRISRTLADMNYAQRRASVLRSSPDRFVPLKDKDKAPATYAEFLFRTSGPLLREPPAAKRARGRLVR
jgi:hypothetical protein